MDTSLIVALIAGLGPIVTGILKKILGTDKKSPSDPTLPNPKKIVNKTLPLFVGIAASVIYQFSTGDVALTEAIIIGLAGGAGASYVRDFDKNITRIFTGISAIIQRRK